MTKNMSKNSICYQKTLYQIKIHLYSFLKKKIFCQFSDILFDFPDEKLFLRTPLSLLFLLSFVFIPPPHPFFWHKRMFTPLLLNNLVGYRNQSFLFSSHIVPGGFECDFKKKVFSTKKYFYPWFVSFASKTVLTFIFHEMSYLSASECYHQ